MIEVQERRLNHVCTLLLELETEGEAPKRMAKAFMGRLVLEAFMRAAKLEIRPEEEKKALDKGQTEG